MKDMSLHLMDIVQNSIAAGADEISLSLITKGNPLELELTVKDNGKGMSQSFLAEVTDPFTTTRKTRDVGLGIPLLKQSAELTGGRLTIESAQGMGTSIQAIFNAGSIDRIPLGDISGIIVMLIMANSEIQWELKFQSKKDEFHLSTSEIKKVLNGVSIQEKEVLNWIQNTVNEGLRTVFGGVLDEVS